MFKKKNKSNPLSPLEQFVLTAVVALGGEAYGAAIQRKLSDMYVAEEISGGSVYITLGRLEVRNYVESWLSEPTPERGGRSRRLFKVTEAGANALKQMVTMQQRSHALLSFADFWRDKWTKSPKAKS
jgi:PadR family transcriptional regulator, regulatory protein PadR